MRLWSLHPGYLDSKGLVALWREGLLARKVLSGGTVGYRHHPQLCRFRRQDDPLAAIGAYLYFVLEESRRRGFSFQGDKIGPSSAIPAVRMTVTRGQLRYELEHLKRKLAQRDPDRLPGLLQVDEPLPHPLFDVWPGGVESWERR